MRLLRSDPIGSGHFADVFIADWSGMHACTHVHMQRCTHMHTDVFLADWSGTPCAVKRLRRSRFTESGLVCFKAEISLHVTLRCLCAVLRRAPARVVPLGSTARWAA